MLSIGLSGIPSFLLKLRRLVDDPETKKIIYWSQDGLSFIINGSSEFSQDVLPLYFKHSNLSSFVRQLNLYDFHKIVYSDTGFLRTDSDVMQFYHPNFVRDDASQMNNIKRKSSRAAAQTPSTELTKVLSEIEKLKNQNVALESSMNRIQSENKMLFEGYNSLRHKLRSQVEVTDKLFKFLIRITMQKNRVHKRKRQPFSLGHGEISDITNSEDLCTALQMNSSSSRAIEGPIIHDITDVSDVMSSDFLKDEACLESAAASNSTSMPQQNLIPSPLSIQRWLMDDALGLPEPLRTNQYVPSYQSDYTPNNRSSVVSPGGNHLCSEGMHVSTTTRKSNILDPVQNAATLSLNPDILISDNEQNEAFDTRINTTYENSAASNIYSNDSENTDKHVLVNKNGGQITSVQLTRFPAGSSDFSSHSGQPSALTETSLQPYQGLINEDKLLSSSSVADNFPQNLDNTSADKMNTINNQLEHLKSSLNSWEDYFSTGDVDIDAESLSTLLSIFADDSGARLAEAQHNGKEVSLYNPLLVDAYTEENEKSKKSLKLELSSAQKDATQDCGLETPRVLYDTQ